MYVPAEEIVPAITLKEEECLQEFRALAVREKKHTEDELEHFIHPSAAQYRPNQSLPSEEENKAVLTIPPPEQSGIRKYGKRR